MIIGSENEIDVSFMRLALQVARKSAELGEVPVGAVLVEQNGSVIAAAGNDCVSSCDPCGHAEIRVLRKAGKRKKNYRFPGATLYVTLEPCCMCASAMVHARIERLVFGALDPKTGAVVSQYRIGSDGRLNHGLRIRGEVLAEECGNLLKNFFRSRR